MVAAALEVSASLRILRSRLALHTPSRWAAVVAQGLTGLLLQLLVIPQRVVEQEEAERVYLAVLAAVAAVRLEGAIPAAQEMLAAIAPWRGMLAAQETAVALQDVAAVVVVQANKDSPEPLNQAQAEALPVPEDRGEIAT
jgi:hypothetical protein